MRRHRGIEDFRHQRPEALNFGVKGFVDPTNDLSGTEVTEALGFNALRV